MSARLRALAVLAGLVLLVPPVAAHDELPLPVDTPVGPVPMPGTPTEDRFSDNMSLLANWDHGGTYRQGSDLAFRGDLAVLGAYDNPGGFRLLDIGDRSSPSLVGHFQCEGPQGDVSIVNDLVFVSVDTPQPSSECNDLDEANEDPPWEGIRIVDISNPATPTQIAAVKTDCGSHTHTLVPDRDHRDPETGEPSPRVLVYVLSYPLTPNLNAPECNVAQHRKISVVEVPLDDPTSARVVSTPDVSPAIGCHDVTVFPEAGLAGAACITESQIWDISDPENPTVVSHIVNPAINIHHSTTFSWDAQTLVIGDELGGALATPGCFTGGHAPLGALWFYDVSDPSAPEPRGSFQIPQQEVSAFCTAHNFNTIPLRGDRDVLVTAWYNGGTAVVDFTDPSAPEQVGFAIPAEGGRAAAWSSYWYRGVIYANNFDEDVNSLTAHSRGFDVLLLDDAEIQRDAVTVGHLNPQTMELPPGLARHVG